MRVLHIYREKRNTGFSIEGIFNVVKQQLKDKIKIDDYYYDPAHSRLANILMMRKHSGDINHITGDVNFLALGLIGKKNVLTVHDLGHYDNLKRSPLRHLIYKLLWFSYPLKYVQAVTVVSLFTKNKLIKYFNFPAHKITVIGNPVKSLFVYSEKAGLNDVPRILQIGTGSHKNLDGLISAAAGLKVHLDIVGWPTEEQITRMNELDISYTVFNGLSDGELYERYVVCDIMFFASFHEGFGMPVTEAQTIGRPVITSNIGAMAEVAGDTAALVDPGKPEEIKATIIKLITDRGYYNSLVALGRENAIKYQPAVIADEYYKVYRSIGNV